MVGVGGLILNKKGQVLLTRRIDMMFPQWNKKWGIPGGHLKFGEDPKEALNRELNEELGVGVKTMLNNPFIASERLNLPNIAYHGIFLCFVCLIIKGKLKRKSKEHSDFKWFKPEEIDFKGCIPLTETFISLYIEYTRKIHLCKNGDYVVNLGNGF